MAVKKTSDQAFDSEVVQAGKPVLVDFWAEWCGPCLQIAPFLDEIASEYDGQIDVVKVNIDENPMTPTKYGVRGIPTLMIFKDGQAVSTKVGALPKSRLVDWVNENL
ncbi:MAG: thioredoxin [Pseudomonadota bacterium]